MKLRTVLMAVIIAMLTIGFMPNAAQAEDGFKPYMHAGVWLGQYKLDKDYTGGDADTESTMLNLPWLRWGGKFMAGDSTGVFEVGFDRASGDPVDVRHAFATTKVGGGVLLFGQTWDPATAANNNPVYQDSGVFFGASTAGRMPQVRYTISGLYIALMRNVAGGVADPDYVLPKLGLGYSMKTDAFSLKAKAGYQGISDESGGTDDGETLTSWFVGADAKVMAGPATISINGYYGVNLGDHGFYDGLATYSSARSYLYGAPAGKGIATSAGSDPAGGYTDTTTYIITVGIDVMNIAAGVTYGVSSNDDWAADDDQMAFWAGYNIALNPNVTITPAFSMWQYGKNGADADQGNEMQYGVKFFAKF